MSRFIIITLFIASFSIEVFAQNEQEQFFSEIELRIDTSLFRWTDDQIHWKGDQHLQFEYIEENSVVEFRFYPIKPEEITKFNILPSKDFSMLDSLVFINQAYYRAKLQFKGITQLNFLQLNLELETIFATTPILFPLPLFPTTQTQIDLRNLSEELFIGEERVFEVFTNNKDNFRLHKNWQDGGEISYKLVVERGKLMLHVLPEEIGIKNLALRLKTRKPTLIEYNSPRFQLPTIYRSFLVKPAKLAFLQMQTSQLELNNRNRGAAIEMEMEYNEGMELEKTYRLEAQETPGGALIAEIFTRSILANGRILCWLRLYSFHRRKKGYLYIKDGDQARFLTNLDILPKTQITKVEIQREGSNWTTTQNVYPGEEVGIRLSGVEVQRMALTFEDLDQIRFDTLASNNQSLIFWAKVPVGVRKKRLQIFDHNQPTGKALKIQEHRRPRPLDFIQIGYGEKHLQLEEFNKIIFVQDDLDDIVLRFDPSQIDKGKLHGPQHLEIEVEIRDQRNQLVEQRTIPRIKVCPDETSPRAHYYKSDKCISSDVALNRFLRKKFFDLNTWSTIRITVKHDERVHKEGFQRTGEFVLHKKSSFDLDVSFPAGLVIKRFGVEGFGNLGGISMAMIAQFSFYKDKAIAKAKPFKFGLGFLALNAFNFSDNNNQRDVGIVMLGSVYPIRTKYSSRLSFPLYGGGGYFLSERRLFVLFGPGIRVRL